jgi:hypothetical protein
MKMVTPKAAAKQDHLFNKLTSVDCVAVTRGQLVKFDASSMTKLLHC